MPVKSAKGPPIKISISTQELKYKPGDAPACFEVAAINRSDRFASFQIEVVAPGADRSLGADWYSLSPEVSTKKPPGDRTLFQISIKDTPVPGFIGIMNLTVRVFSLELRDEQRQVLRLIVEPGINLVPLDLELPVKSLQAYPRELVQIPVRVLNPSSQSTDIALKLSGLNPAWLNDEDRRLHLEPGEQKEVRFRCQLPIPSRVPSQVYPFTIEALHRYGPVCQAAGTLEVLPMGEVQFSCMPHQHQIPTQQRWLPTWQNHPVTYDLQFENQSNILQQVSVDIRGKHQQQCTLQVMPDRASLSPGDTVQTHLVVDKRRPWIGRPQQLLLKITSVLSDLRLGDTKPTSQTVELRVLPILPPWLQLLAGVLLLLLLVLLLWLLQPGHTGPVYSVSFNGLGDRVVSGSNDQTMRSWSVRGDHLESQGVLAQSRKAVRVVRYRPVDNNLVAAGLENGEIQLWDPLSEQLEQHEEYVKHFVFQQDDRVFGLAFTKDSRSLFSAHGSGWVLQWPLTQDDSNSDVTPSLKNKFDFAAYALTFVDEADRTLAIGGRYNNLLLWDWSHDRIRHLPYPTRGGQDDYIYSLATAQPTQARPHLLATADNQGKIVLWDLRQCLSADGDCKILDTWSQGHGPVRSVALSPEGCYLASAGDDGRVMLWPLTSGGVRSPEFTEGKEIARLPTKINSVDLIAVKSDILVASGAEDDRVRLYRLHKSNPDCESRVPSNLSSI